MIYSSSSVWAQYKYNDSFKYVKNQLLFFVIGLFLIRVISNIDYKIYVKNHIGSYIVSIIFSIIYLCLYGYGFYALAKLLFGARDGAAIPGGILFILLSPFLFIILFLTSYKPA